MEQKPAFGRLRTLDPNHANACCNLAAAQLEAADTRSAVENIRRAIRMSSDCAPQCCVLAEELEREGLLNEAFSIYQDVSQLLPESSVARFGAAHVLLSQRRLEQSRDWYEEGLELDASHAPAWTNLGCIHSALGEKTKSIESFRNAIRADSRFASAHYNLGNELTTQGQFSEAMISYRIAIELDPRNIAVLKNLGNAHVSLGEFAEAESCYRRALTIQPDEISLHLNLGQVLKQQRMFEEAITQYRLVLEAEPGNAAVHYVLGRTLELAGHADEAIASYKQSAELNPVDVHTRFYLGNALKSQGRMDEAIVAYQEAQTLDPAHASTIYQLGNAYRHQKHYDDARRCYDEVLRLRPDDYETMISLGNVLKLQDDLVGAAAQYRTVLEQLPDQPLWKLWTATLCPIVFHSTVGIDDYRNRLFRELKHLARKQVRITPQEITQCGCPPPYGLQFHGRDDRPLKEGYARVFENCLHSDPSGPRGGKPLVGFVVTDGHEGVFLRYLGGVIERMNPELFDIRIICSAGGKARLERDLHVDSVKLLVIPSRYDEIVETIRSAQFDLLYHWEIGSDVTNYFLPFFRLAPVQCTGAGVPVTSGIPQVDFFLSDGIAEPEGAEQHYCETLIRGSSLMTYERRLALPDVPKSRADFGFSPAQHIYLCPHKIEKFHPELDLIFRDILRCDPAGVVVIPKDREGHAARKLRSRLVLTAADVAERIIFVPYQTLNGYLSLLAAADVLLDPLHYGGGLTSLDGFSLNRPIVTLPGEFLRGRFTYGFYQRMGILDCIADSPETYVEIAVRIATDAHTRMNCNTDFVIEVTCSLKTQRPWLNTNNCF
jgi:tetratricopeptide (TPR) repeat protein